jgi:dynactin complex subunit
MEDESEFFDKEGKLREKNREELIKLQLKLSLLKSQDDKVTEELKTHKEQNLALKKENEDLDKFNTKEEEEISLVIQRI